MMKLTVADICEKIRYIESLNKRFNGTTDASGAYHIPISEMDELLDLIDDYKDILLNAKVEI